MNELVIFGSAEIADLAYYYFKNDSNYRVVAFTVDDEYVNQSTMCGLPLLPYSQTIKEFPSDVFNMHVALSYGRLNQLRQEKYIQAKNSGYKLASYICSKSVLWPDLLHGDNCFVLENQTIQPLVKIGNNVMIWSGNHLGHGSRIGDHTYISSHVVISGNCVIGERCFFGVNSTVKDFSQIGSDCFIAMDASITRDMPDGSIALGESAKFIDGEDRRAKVIKKKYFHF
jgi:sugar O-acyltransferase (sialic acid O-acetyltransferase NeuD family)